MIMKLKEIVSEKEYDIIEFREKIIHKKKEYDYFVGMCSYKNGELESLDGDNYSLETEIESYDEFSNKEKGVLKGLEVYLKVRDEPYDEVGK